MLALILLTVGGSHQTAAGDVVVLANRTNSAVRFRLIDGARAGAVEVLPAGETLPIPTYGPCELDAWQSTGRKRYQLHANAAYFFGALSNGGIELHQIGLGGDRSTQLGRRLGGEAREFARLNVLVLVDEEEPGQPRLWQDRLRRRIQAASEILENYCRLRLDIVGFGTWNSDDTTHDFFQSMAEFEREVDPRPGRLAIGFSSQYHAPDGRTHLGGTRGPLHSHILLREWSRHVSERERLELLVHELGHYLGAAHSPEANSVMRPVLGDRKARAPRFAIRFDPVNALTTYLIVEEMRYRGIQSFDQLTPQTKLRLHQVYTALGRANPSDESAKRFAQLSQQRHQPQPLQQDTQLILQQIIIASRTSPPPGRATPTSAAANDGESATAKGQSGDRHLELVLRRAAQAATRLDERRAQPAFLLALGIALDDSDGLRTYPPTAEFVRAVESDADRTRRVQAMGPLTMRDREDLAKHFFVSAHLTAAIGKVAAHDVGETKEILDAATSSGFSFCDIAANRAGIAFASRVMERSLSLSTLANGFDVEEYMPPIHELPEGLSLTDFQRDYGGKTDARFLARLREIDERIQSLYTRDDDKAAIE